MTNNRPIVITRKHGEAVELEHAGETIRVIVKFCRRRRTRVVLRIDGPQTLQARRVAG